MPHEPTATRSKSPEPVTPSTFQDRKRWQLWSKKPHRTLSRRTCKVKYLGCSEEQRFQRLRCRVESSSPPATVERCRRAAEGRGSRTAAFSNCTVRRSVTRSAPKQVIPEVIDKFGVTDGI